MNKKIFFFFFLISLSLNSQIVFEKGYYIDRTNSKIEGFIKNEEWLSTPNSLTFKKNENGVEYQVSSKEILEFEVYGQLKYKRFLVKIYDTKLELKDNRKPTYVEKELLLNTLVEGDVSLYEVKNNSTYLIQNSAGKTLQLINFNVQLPDNNITLFSTYKQDLKLFLECDNIKDYDFNNLKLKRKSLINFILDYNNCKNSKSNLFKFTNKPVKFFVIPKLGFSYNSLSLENQNIKFEENLSGFGYYLGAEMEISLPFNKRKWSVIIEPSYVLFEADKSSAQNNSNGISTKDSRFQLGYGVRHYLYMEKYQLYLTGRFFTPISSEREVKFSTFDDSTDFVYKGNLSFGIGARFKNRIYSEVNFAIWNGDEPKFNTTNMDFSTFTSTLTIGYRIF